MTDQTKTVLEGKDDGILNLILNRPEKKNALNDTMIAELKNALHRTDQDATVRAIIITGAGPDFCSGADLSALRKISTASVVENADDARSLMDLFMQLRLVKVPVIAAVRGRALAGGCGLASACDLVLASTSARFGYPEVQLGFVPAMVMAILRRNVSEKRTFALLTRGGEIGAAEAQQMGLVNEVFADDEFDDKVKAYIEVFKKVSRSAVTLTKELLYATDGMAFAEALQTGADVNVIARLTADCQKGIARFLKK